MLDNAAAMLDLPESMNDDGSATQPSKFVVTAIPILLVAWLTVELHHFVLAVKNCITERPGLLWTTI